MTDRIEFYSPSDLYGEFSNFAYPMEPILTMGYVVDTSEHFFQAMKFITTDPAYAKQVLKASGPGEAARMGRDRSKPLRKDWESIKDDVMRIAVFTKFTQFPYLKKRLLDTGDALLVEHTDKDSYWADGGDGSGKNMLGKILMEIRGYIRNPSSDKRDHNRIMHRIEKG